jgi:hypothetical protein
MKDRFDLEAAIMDVWATKDHLDKVIWRMIDHPEVMSEDQVWNHLEAVKMNIDLHCEKLMDTFCQVFELNEYASDEVKAMRAAILRQHEERADKEDLPPFPVPNKKAKKQGKAK